MNETLVDEVLESLKRLQKAANTDETKYQISHEIWKFINLLTKECKKEVHNLRFWIDTEEAQEGGKKVNIQYLYIDVEFQNKEKTWYFEIKHKYDDRHSSPRIHKGIWWPRAFRKNNFYSIKEDNGFRSM